jgi:hypothetical protein
MSCDMNLKKRENGLNMAMRDSQAWVGPSTDFE